MDLLSSILGSMDRPPSKQQKDTNIYEKQRKDYECVKNRQREDLNRFRTYVEERLGRFIKDENLHNVEFQSMDKVHRSIVHDVSETAGLTGMSFGMQGERYIVVYKKEHLPCEDELNARKNGEVWTKETAAQYAEQRRLKQLKQLGDTNDLHITRAEKFRPVFSCTKKYMQLFSEEVKMDNVRKTEINASYGYVPSANKKDVRSIEQTMADILAKKRLKTHHAELDEEPYSTEVSSEASRHIPGATD
ncbi:sperm-associated antigen 7 homolog [Anopheles merus]|uniref:sperm-associated antigen 7 homolog n=1 Tax=Anopheles merus TaxID=30066 RepID=UPI001BE4DA15|nr:sperm-associated antigen 7 homolog [Anopheles merus]